MTRRLLLLWVILCAAPWPALGQATLPRLVPAPDAAAQASDVEPPYPQRLATDWWQYFEAAGEQLPGRVEEMLERLQALSGELESRGRDALLPLVEQVATALEAWRDLRERPAPTPAVLPPVPREVGLATFLELDQRLRDLRREVAVIAQNMQALAETAELGKRQLDTARLAYQRMLGSAEDTLEPGLELMRDRLRLELVREDLRLRRESHDLRADELARLRPLVADAAARLAISAADARGFERRAEAARARAEALDDELAQKGLERIYGTPEAAVDQAAARLQALEIAETEVRRARALVEESLYATAAGLPGGDRAGAEAESLRALIADAQALRQSTVARLSGWQPLLTREREDAMRALATVEGSSGATAPVHRARLRVADTLSESLAALAQYVVNLERVLDVATARLADKEGVFGGSMAGLRAFAASALDAAGEWFRASLFEVGNAPVTPLGLLRVALIIAIALLVSRMVRRWLDRMRSGREGGSQAALYTLSRMLHYVLLVVGTLIALSSIGIDFTKFALFASALGVGIGFGLQTLISNFVAGIIILFERSLKVGDFIELESGVQGEVREINIRSTLVKTNENIDILVPNAELISGRVVNWTMQAPNRRLHLPFPVAFGADRELVRKAGLEAASELPYTLSEGAMKPQVWLVGFDDDRMKFELVVWLSADAVKRPSAVSAAYYWALAGALDRHGIALPFPQRDLHLKSFYGLTGEAALEAAADRPGGTASTG